MKKSNGTVEKKDTNQDGLTTDGRLSNISKPLGLTTKQFEILKLLAEGNRPSEIAVLTQNSVFTIRTHIRAIIDRMNARNIEHCISKMYEQNKESSTVNPT